MTPSEYFRDLVEPTIAEFEQNPTSIRHAYAACLFVCHFADAVAAHKVDKMGRPLAEIRRGIKRELPGIRKKLGSLAPAFWTVQGIANMAKHVELTDPGLTVRPKVEDTHIGGEAAFERGRFWEGGRSWEGAKEVVRTRDDHGNPVDVLWCVREARRAIETYLGHLPVA